MVDTLSDDPTTKLSRTCLSLHCLTLTPNPVSLLRDQVSDILKCRYVEKQQLTSSQERRLYNNDDRAP